LFSLRAQTLELVELAASSHHGGKNSSGVTFAVLNVDSKGSYEAIADEAVMERGM
jgi:hypothetical protein